MKSLNPTRTAVVLLSGGLDSATCLAIAGNAGFTCHAISFRYGQRHQYELQRAERLAKHFAVASHRIVDIDLAQFGGSALTDPQLAIPKSDSLAGMGSAIPITYVPARNTVFLSLALAFAEVIDSHDIFIGVNALDYSGYPDCRPEFIAAFQAMANLATKASVEGPTPLTIHTPLIALTKGQIIAKGLALGIDYGMTLSCYDPGPGDPGPGDPGPGDPGPGDPGPGDPGPGDPGPGGKPCGHCDACLLRQKGFGENGLADPAIS